MGLEAATYIHQLNPLNPVGAVDPKAQGDDHLRMIKAALQATFPNINGAMTVSLANLNQWAGLAGAYAWTGQHSWALALRIPDGTAGAPALSFSGDTDTGIYRATANGIGFSAGGVETFEVQSGFVLLRGTGTQLMVVADGTASLPDYTFNGDNNTGIYRVSADWMGFVAGGSYVTGIRNVAGALKMLSVDGTVTDPFYSFNSDPDTGIYRVVANEMRFSSSGVFAAAIGGGASTPYVQSGGQFFSADGAVGAPAYTFSADTNTGIYRSGTDTVALVGGGAIGLQVDGTGAYMPDGSAGIPGLKFNSDTDTGFYRINANELGFSEGGNGFRIGFRNVPRSTTATTLVAGDNGKCVAVSAAINIPASVFSAGDCVSIYNDSAASINITISAGTLRLAGTTTTGTRVLAPRGMATLWFNVGGATPEAIASGPGVS